MSKDEEIIRISTKALPAPGTITSGTLGYEAQKSRMSIPASGGVAWSGDTPVLTWRQKIYPASGGGVDASANPTAETWGSWVNVVTPAQDFEVVKVEALLKQKDAYYIEIGESGQATTDISHISVVDSGSLIIDTLNPPHRYSSGDDVSVRTKSQRGSGIESSIWIFTREPS